METWYRFNEYAMTVEAKEVLRETDMYLVVAVEYRKSGTRRITKDGWFRSSDEAVNDYAASLDARIDATERKLAALQLKRNELRQKFSQALRGEE